MSESGVNSQQSAKGPGGAGKAGGWLALLGVLVLAAALRVHEIDRLDVWVDEANAFLTARRPLPVILSMLKLDSSPPAYYFALHFWMSLFGDGVTALRMLAATAGVALVGSVYVVGAQWISRPVGLWAAFVVACSPVQIFYSQQVRMYPLLSLFALWSVWSLVRYLQTGSPRWLASCLALSAAALYTHNFAFHLMLVLAAVVVLSGQLGSRWRAWALSAVVLAAVYAPWLGALRRQLANADHYAWYLPLWEQYGALGAVWKTLLSWAPAAGFAMFEYRGGITWGAWPAAAFTALAGFGVVRLLSLRTALGPAGASWVPAFVVVPALSAIAVSAWLTPHFVPGRVDQMMYPGFALLVGLGICGLRPWASRAAAGVAILALGLATRSVFATDYREYHYRGADRAMAAVVREEWRPGDVILCTSLTRAPLEYYLRDLDATFLSYPRETAAHLGAQNDPRLLEDLDALAREAEVVMAQARQRAGPKGRLLLARSRLSVNDPLGPEALYRRFSAPVLENLGRFAQVGTEDVIWLSLHRLRLGPGAGREPE